jgi:hypothetical protein
MGAVTTPFPLSCAEIAEILGSPLMHVTLYWPLLEGCMNSLGLATDAVKVAALATIGVECPRFCAQEELGGERYWTQHYEGRADLGNAEPGDGARFHGRGLIQLTGRKNYHEYGRQIGVDLVAHPDEANEPAAACAIFATYFYLHHDLEAAAARDWKRVRKSVNGGLNGYLTFLKYVEKLEAALQTSAATPAGAVSTDKLTKGAVSNG